MARSYVVFPPEPYRTETRTAASLTEARATAARMLNCPVARMVEERRGGVTYCYADQASADTDVTGTGAAMYRPGSFVASADMHSTLTQFGFTCNLSYRETVRYGGTATHSFYDHPGGYTASTVYDFEDGPGWSWFGPGQRKSGCTNTELKEFLKTQL